MVRHCILLIAISLIVISCGKEELNVSQLTLQSHHESNQQDQSSSTDEDTQNSINPQDESTEQQTTQPDSSTLPQSPEDYVNMARRATLRLRSNTQIEEEFELDKLWKHENLELFTPSYLNRFVEFYTTTHNGTPYIFNEADLQQCAIENITYDATRELVSFTFKYKNTRSEQPLTFTIHKNKYYAHQVQVVNGFANNMYIRGVKEHYAIFGGRAINYDRNRYAIVCTKAYLNSDTDTQLSLEYQLSRADNEQVIATFRKEVTGFCPLQQLTKELYPKMTYEIKEYMEKVFSVNTPLGDVTDKLAYRNVNYWIKMVDFDLVQPHRTRDLTWENDRLTGYGTDALDLYLDRPRFQLISAKMEEDQGRRFLLLHIALQSVNESAVDSSKPLPPLRIHITRK